VTQLDSTRLLSTLPLHEACTGNSHVRLLPEAIRIRAQFPFGIRNTANNSEPEDWW